MGFAPDHQITRSFLCGPKPALSEPVACRTVSFVWLTFLASGSHLCSPIDWAFRAVLTLTSTFCNFVIPTAVKRARAFTSARVGRRDLVLAFKVHAIYKTR